ncbi:MAG TPA: hypothetical protein VM510_17205 [Caulifigura sp.]|nr:hypothetical protein [Caulifigura sp.]
MSELMAGRSLRTYLCALLAWIAASGKFCLGDEPAAPDLTVRQMQEGGYVFDKGTRLVKDPRLKISIIPMFETFRTQAPLNVSVRLQWTGTGLLEGRILCDMYAFERYVGSWKSHELAVNDQILSFPLILPPSPLYNDRDQFNLRIAFEAADRTIIMDQRDLPIESAWSRNYVVGVVAPQSTTRIGGFTGKDVAPQVADLFQVASFHDHVQHASQFVTNTTPVETHELPVDPLRLTAFDIVVLSPESLREIRPPQWQALATWIRAGGRACLVATAPVPENLRASWRELFNERPDEPLMTFSDRGRPEFTTGKARLRVRAGCGRILCLNEPAIVDGRDWLEDVLWLLAVRDAPRSSILSKGKWAIGAPVDTSVQVTFHPMVPAMRPIPEMRRPLNSPEIGKVSPLMILLLLGTCLILIGPVDYYVLGRYGLRRWTWVFLPCVSIATTWATMRVSQSALGAKDYARAISVADLDSVGRVARVSRIEQRYAGREGVHQRSMTSTYRVDFERPLFGWNSSSNKLVPWEGVRGGDDASNQPPLRYEGKVTGGYEVLEPMYQWSPRLFRETTFGDDARINSKSLAAINWGELQDVSWATVQGRQKIRELVRAAVPEAEVYVRFQLVTVDCSNPDPSAAMAKPEAPRFGRAMPPEELAVSGVDPESPEAFVHVVGRATSCQRTYVDQPDVYRQAVTRPFGLFGLVRERSPTCGADLEDLQWIDSEDPTEAVLMILVKGDEPVIYRRRLALAAESR